MKISDGKYLSMTDVFKSFTNRGAQQIAQEISDGAILGETNRQIADRLERLSGLHKNQAMTIARTATNNVATVARNQVMQENEDVLDGYEWVAALDNRTTILCGSLDGQVFSFSDPDAPKPPAHFNCRSTIVPKVKPEFTLGADIEGERPAIGADGKEQTGAGTNYETWLRRQPAAFQDEVLGKDRGKLFRGKKLSLDRFIDAKGNPIPLDQLKALDESFNIKAKARPPKEVPKVLKEKITRFSLKDKVVTRESTVGDFEKTIERLSNDRTKSVIYKTKRPSIVEKNGGVYYPLQELLESSPLRKDGSTLIHEYGHHIDHMIGDSVGKKFTGISASSDSFVNAFLNDRKKLGLHTRKTRFPKLDELAGLLANSEVKVYSNNFKETIRKVKSHYHGQITDIIDAMTEGAFHSYGVSGHGQKYYKFKDNRYNETFAQMFSLQGAPDEIKKIVKELFPETLKAFEDILDEYIKNGVNTYDG
jgi:SPP1 gp7 family putative phage head morphogenesis protein